MCGRSSPDQEDPELHVVVRSRMPSEGPSASCPSVRPWRWPATARAGVRRRVRACERVCGGVGHCRGTAPAACDQRKRGRDGGRARGRAHAAWPTRDRTRRLHRILDTPNGASWAHERACSARQSVKTLERGHSPAPERGHSPAPKPNQQGEECGRAAGQTCHIRRRSAGAKGASGWSSLWHMMNAIKQLHPRLLRSSAAIERRTGCMLRRQPVQSCVRQTGRRDA